MCEMFPGHGPVLAHLNFGPTHWYSSAVVATMIRMMRMVRMVIMTCRIGNAQHKGLENFEKK